MTSMIRLPSWVTYAETLDTMESLNAQPRGIFRYTGPYRVKADALRAVKLANDLLLAAQGESCPNPRSRR